MGYVVRVGVRIRAILQFGDLAVVNDLQLLAIWYGFRVFYLEDLFRLFFVSMRPSKLKSAQLDRIYVKDM